MKYKKKDTNGFDTAIFGLDLFLIWVFKKIFKKK
jgi:hypothetical protein